VTLRVVRLREAIYHQHCSFPSFLDFIIIQTSLKQKFSSTSNYTFYVVSAHLETIIKMPSTMLLAAAFSVFAALSSAQSTTVSRVGGVAPIVTNNPLGARYIALFPVTTNSPVNGSVAAESIMNGTGIRFSVQLSGLPENVGAFRKLSLLEFFDASF